MQGPIAATMRSGRAPSPAIAPTVASTTPASAPRQPAWAAPITPAVGVREQHRRAVGAEHAERDARAVADQRVGRALGPPRPRRASEHDLDAVDLAGRGQASPRRPRAAPCASARLRSTRAGSSPPE